MSAVDREELLSQIKVQAYTVVMFSSNEPQFDLPEPEGMADLDSFSVVQLLLALEDSYDVTLLEDFASFGGTSFEDLADFIAPRIEAKEKEPQPGA
ncbi:hypothetical protein [Nocardiopsis trehalosi]|jgi:acyl carrier protein|uniref:hypothetical protein n=1 Tax=Nocardiopsis trehalosi TaxID=109329 RepID=UPI0008347A77|nr:hypothetical protein [Nocardiopsis trehalosi]